MKKNVLSLSLFAVLFVLRAPSSFASDPTISQDCQSSDQIPGLRFIPTDTAPLFRNFKIVLSLHADDFSKWIFPYLESDSFEEINATEALSDHYITWGEIAIFLTNIAHSNILQWNILKEDYDYILQEMMSYFVQKADGTWEIKENFYNQPALLPLSFLEYYARWREVRYWLYRQLRAQEMGCYQGIEGADTTSDQLTRYFTKKGLVPIVDVVHGVDHLNEILKQGVDVVMYCILEDGTNTDQLSDQSTYHLATIDELSEWQSTHGGTLNEIASSEKKGYGLLAVSTTKMKHEPDFNIQEEKLQAGERDHYFSFQADNEQQVHEIEESNSASKWYKSGMEWGGLVVYSVGAIIQFADLWPGSGLQIGARASGEGAAETAVDLTRATPSRVLEATENAPVLSPTTILKHIEETATFKNLSDSSLFTPSQYETMLRVINTLRIKMLKEKLVGDYIDDTIVEKFESFDPSLSYEGNIANYESILEKYQLNVSSEPGGGIKTVISQYNTAQDGALLNSGEGQKYFPVVYQGQKLNSRSVHNIESLNGKLLYNNHSDYEKNFAPAWMQMKKELQEKVRNQQSCENYYAHNRKILSKYDDEAKYMLSRRQYKQFQIQCNQKQDLARYRLIKQRDTEEETQNKLLAEEARVREARVREARVRETQERLAERQQSEENNMKNAKTFGKAIVYHELGSYPALEKDQSEPSPERELGYFGKLFYLFGSQIDTVY